MVASRAWLTRIFASVMLVASPIHGEASTVDDLQAPDLQSCVIEAVTDTIQEGPTTDWWDPHSTPADEPAVCLVRTETGVVGPAS